MAAAGPCPGLEKPAGLLEAATPRGQHPLAGSAAEAWPVGRLGLGILATRTLADVLSLQTGDRGGRTVELETVRAPMH